MLPLLAIVTGMTDCFYKFELTKIALKAVIKCLLHKYHKYCFIN